MTGRRGIDITERAAMLPADPVVADDLAELDVVPISKAAAAAIALRPIPLAAARAGALVAASIAMKQAAEQSQRRSR